MYFVEELVKHQLALPERQRKYKYFVTDIKLLYENFLSSHIGGEIAQKGKAFFVFSKQEQLLKMFPIGVTRFGPQRKHFFDYELIAKHIDNMYNYEFSTPFKDIVSRLVCGESCKVSPRELFGLPQQAQEKLTEAINDSEKTIFFSSSSTINKIRIEVSPSQFLAIAKKIRHDVFCNTIFVQSKVIHGNSHMFLGGDAKVFIESFTDANGRESTWTTALTNIHQLPAIILKKLKKILYYSHTVAVHRHDSNPLAIPRIPVNAFRKTLQLLQSTRSDLFGPQCNPEELREALYSTPCYCCSEEHFYIIFRYFVRADADYSDSDTTAFVLLVDKLLMENKFNLHWVQSDV
tara:strand:- start:400 stop:1443 length:1044 start_codon:yes stop_codon:yes gene_type:complete